MPSDFGDITAHHRDEVARHLALAQAARERESFSEAEYHATMAARWEEAAGEQKIQMRQEPAPPIADPEPRRWPPEPPPISFFSACRLAILHGLQRIASASRQSRPKRSAPSQGLSLR